MKQGTIRGDQRGRVGQISQYLDPGCMTKEQWVEFTDRNGHTPNWPPAHSRALSHSHSGE